MDGITVSRSTPPGPLGRAIADAADELAGRIEMGEFDDLDESQMVELRLLSRLMAQWSDHARLLEQRLAQADGYMPSPRAAFCN